MLRGIRKASENWLGRTVMGVVMSVLAGRFPLWGINDIFRGFGPHQLAKVRHSEIPVEQFRQTYQDRMQQVGRQLGRPLTPEQARGLDRQVLGEMIVQAGLDQRARKMGLGLSDADIARHITSDPKLQTATGQFDKPKFEFILPNLGYSTHLLVAEHGKKFWPGKFLNSVTADIVPPKAWLDAVNQFQNEERNIEYMALGPAQAGNIPQPTEEQLKKYFDKRKIIFRA